jgi:peptide/nickel transport system ATP-binding protein
VAVTESTERTDAATAALEIDDLWVSLPTGHGEVDLVRSVSLSVAPGECLGIVGESGAGKSLTCYAALGLVARNGLDTRGTVRLDGRTISGLGPAELSKIRGRDVSIIFQEPSVSLNPAFRVGAQIAEVVRWHRGCSRSEAWDRAVECLRLVGVPNPSRRAKEYPHTLSGGLRQRAMIALALACEPKVLIADEATTALDVTIQAQILRLLRGLQDTLGMALVVVTHDLGVVAELCDRVAVMYAGQVVEQADVDSLFVNPRHPYTQGLLDAVPTIDASDAPLLGIPGSVPSPDADLPGCWFAPRCTFSTTECRDAPPPLVDVGDGRLSRCVRWDAVELPGVRRSADAGR